MDNRYAVMDLGTNTFHLLIVEVREKGFTELVHEQAAVKLGEGGINQGLIQDAAFDRGLTCMKRFSDLLEENKIKQVRVIATSALRNAKNGQGFIDAVKKQTGLKIEIIDGNAEAEFIYKGVRASGCLSDKNTLIIDIGGGSAEFIICNNREIFWKQSFEIGAARLMDRFHRSDPIPPDSINALELYLQDCLQQLFLAIGQYPVNGLVGSSGVFESYAGIIEKQHGHPFDLKKVAHYSFDHDDLLALLEKIILSTHQQRLAESGIIPVRVDMIVTTSILTRFIIKRSEANKVLMCTNSLKEGVLADMME